MTTLMQSSKFSSNYTCSVHSPHHHTNSALLSSAPPPPIRPHGQGLSEIMADEDVNNAKHIIKRWEVNANKFGRFSSLFLTDRIEAKKFLEATVGLQHAMNYYVKLSANSDKLVGAQQLMQIAMKRLKFEFYTILSANRNNLDSGSISGRYRVSISTTAPPSPASEAERAVEDLKSVSECMVTCGYGKECVSIYRTVRKSIIEETLYDLGIERLTNSQLKKMEWTILEAKIKRWLHAVKIAVATLFYREKIICDAVFSSSEKIAEACFASVSRDVAADLFAFAENVCKCKKILSPEKIFRLLDLYEAISDLWADIRFIFSDKWSAAVISQAAAAQMKLGETVTEMLGQFEEAIRKDSSPPPRGGSIHPLTGYVINFLVFLGDYGAAVANIVEDWPVKVRLCIPDSGGEADASTAEISRRLAWLIIVVLCKLNSKAAAYNDVALSYLFLANNLNYVVSKARNSNLGLLIGQDWIRNHELKVKSYLDKYERIGWSDVMAAVPANPAVVIPPSKVSECFENFSVSFQKAYRKQSSWVIPDPKIREDVKISLSKRVVSGYRILCEQSKMAGLVVKYAPEDLQKYLLALFTADS